MTSSTQSCRELEGPPGLRRLTPPVLWPLRVPAQGCVLGRLRARGKEARWAAQPPSAAARPAARSLAVTGTRFLSGKPCVWGPPGGRGQRVCAPASRPPACSPVGSDVLAVSVPPAVLSALPAALSSANGHRVSSGLTLCSAPGPRRVVYTHCGLRTAPSPPPCTLPPSHTHPWAGTRRPQSGLRAITGSHLTGPPALSGLRPDGRPVPR